MPLAMTGLASPRRLSPVCYNKVCMERFLNAIGAWRRDPQVVIPLLGAIASGTVVLLFLVDVFPLSPVNFWFFSVLLILLSLYRPNWSFLALVAALPFEIIVASPDSLGLSLRLYQWIFLALSLALVVRVISRRTPWPLFSASLLDCFLALIPVGAVISGLIGGGQGVRLAIIVASFYMLYLLGRVFLKTVGDVRIAVATLFASGAVTAFHGIIQNIAFERGVNLYAVMPGRPNAFFTEPDWFGFLMALLLAIALARLAAVLERFTDRSSVNFAQILLAALLLLPIVVALILTVSRSAWLGAVGGVFVWALATVVARGKESIHFVLQSIQSLVIVFVVALVIVIDLPLTRFDLLNRAESTATGLQEITVACDMPADLPETIASIDELAAFNCRHIDLEERSALQSAGVSIQTVRRPDPNVAIRSEIYAKTWRELRAHPVFGIGWGNIGAILGMDENGSAYNASNIWLEIVLGAGLIGFVGLAGAIGFILSRWFASVFHAARRESNGLAHPLVVTFLTIFFVFNLFNAGLLIGLVWIGFAVLPPLLSAVPKTEKL